MKVPVHKIVGDVDITYKDGERLQREFREAFDRGDTVELDFDKTRIFADRILQRCRCIIVREPLSRRIGAEIENRKFAVGRKRALGSLARQCRSLLSRSNFPGSSRQVLANLAAEAQRTCNGKRFKRLKRKINGSDWGQPVKHDRDARPS